MEEQVRIDIDHLKAISLIAEFAPSANLYFVMTPTGAALRELPRFSPRPRNDEVANWFSSWYPGFREDKVFRRIIENVSIFCTDHSPDENTIMAEVTKLLQSFSPCGIYIQTIPINFGVSQTWLLTISTSAEPFVMKVEGAFVPGTSLEQKPRTLTDAGLPRADKVHIEGEPKVSANERGSMPTPQQCYQTISYLLEHLHEEFEKGHEAQVQAFCTLFAAYLAILDQSPEDGRALQGLYRVAILFRTSPPALPDIMTRVRAYYEDRLETNPRDAQACIRICQVEKILRGTDSETGKDWVRKALEIDPNNSDAHLEVAYAYKQQGKRQDALNEVDHAIRLNSANADAYACKALILKPIDGTAALREYRKCYEKDPTHLQAIVMIKGFESASKGKPWWKRWWRFSK